MCTDTFLALIVLFRNSFEILIHCAIEDFLNFVFKLFIFYKFYKNRKNAEINIGNHGEISRRDFVKKKWYGCCKRIFDNIGC